MPSCSSGTIDEVVVGYATLEFEILARRRSARRHRRPLRRARGACGRRRGGARDRPRRPGGRGRVHRASTRSRCPVTARRRTSSNAPASPPARCIMHKRLPLADDRADRERHPADRSKSRSARSSCTTVDCCSCGGGGARRSGSGRRRAAGSSSVRRLARRRRARGARGDGHQRHASATLAGWAERTGDATGSVPLRDPRLLRHAERFDRRSRAGDDAADARWVPLAEVACARPGRRPLRLPGRRR